MLKPGDILGTDFEIRERLSQGGMGAVYLAYQRSTDTLRAVKVMLPEWVDRPDLRERFELEAKASGRIPSEHVVKVVAFGVDAGRRIPWMAMEYLSGQTLEDRVLARGNLPPVEVYEVCRQLFHGVAAAHQVRVVHRDLKPPNVFIADSLRADVPFTVKVLDFGIAKLLRESNSGTRAMGTHAWMAPEQEEQGATILPTADVWALGLCVFWLVTGKQFWVHAESSAPLLSKEVHFDEIPPASVRARMLGGAAPPPGFDDWFRGSVARDRALRFADASSCWSALEPVLTAWIDAARRAEQWGAPGELPTQPVAPSWQARESRTSGAPSAPPTTTAPSVLRSARSDSRQPSATPRAVWLALAAVALLGSSAVAVVLGITVWQRLSPVSNSPAARASAAPGATSAASTSAASTSAAPTATALAASSAVSLERSEQALAPVPPSGMLWVAPGRFVMGSGVAPPHGPERAIEMTRGFFIDAREVTTAEYTECVTVSRCTASGVHGPGVEASEIGEFGHRCNEGQPERSLHPINCIDRIQAETYCAFRGKRLPTEAEWEYAARGSDARMYPWGNDPPEMCDMAVVSGLCSPLGTRPVGTRSELATSPSGARDMAGNVWEWVADGYDPLAYRQSGSSAPVVTRASNRGVLRGGSWDFARSHAKVVYRLAFDFRTGHVSTGVRCAQNP